MPEPNEAILVTPPKITFSAEQQTKVDELIRESMGRAGNEARATAARLEAEAVVLKAELAALRGDRSGLEKETKTAKQELLKLKKEAIFADAASKHGFVDPKQVTKLVSEDIVFVPEKNTFHIVNEDGSVRTGLDGSPLGLDAFFQDFANRNGHLVRGTVKPGVGSRENQLPTPAVGERERLSKLFGRGSDAVACNRLAISDPAEFKKQRLLAKSYGLI
jgi:hypothetical protein